MQRGEGKHGTYHSKYECDNGGLFDADACPNNDYDMRAYKANLLQNVGSASNYSSFDTILQHPNGCSLYQVWGTAKFGGASAFRDHFLETFTWVLP